MFAAPDTPAGESAPELRVDPLTGRCVLVAGDRAARPGGLPEPEPSAPLGGADDPFAEGQETRTPLEVWADRPGGGAPNTPGWRVRSVPNLYPALAQSFADDDSAAGATAIAESGGVDSSLLASATAYGVHEVIVNCPRPVWTLADLSLDELRAALDGWSARIREHRADPRVAYAHVCVNEGRTAGASLPHTHAQLYVLPFVPALVARERDRMRDHFTRSGGRALMDDLLAEEARDGRRVVTGDDDAVLVCPFAAATPYRLWVAPRRTEPRFEDSPHKGAAILHRALAALRDALGGMPALNLWVRTAPNDAKGFGWRIEIAPRLGQPAGLEYGTDVYINAVPPETAAQRLRAALGE